MQPTLVILAAGTGGHYGGLKQMDPAGPGGETTMDYSIYDARRAGFGKLVFVIRRDLEALFKETVGARFEKRLPVEYVSNFRWPRWTNCARQVLPTPQTSKPASKPRSLVSIKDQTLTPERVNVDNAKIGAFLKLGKPMRLRLQPFERLIWKAQP